MNDFKSCKPEKEKKLYYDSIKKYFRKDAADRKGYYKDKTIVELRNGLLKRTMWKIYIKSLDEILQNNPEINSVVDVGCGMGNFTYELTTRQKFERIVGLDFLRETFNLALDNPKIFKDIDFIEGNILFMPFENRSFDVSFCLNVIHHIHRDDFKKAMKELTRITDKYLVLEIRNKKNIFDFWYNRFILSNFYRELPLYISSASEVDGLLKDLGFKLLVVKGKMSVSWACRRLVLTYKRVD